MHTRPSRAARVAALRALPVHWEPDAEEIQLAYIEAQVRGLEPESTYEHVWGAAHVLASSEALRHLVPNPAVARALRIWCLVTADRIADAAVPAVARG